MLHGYVNTSVIVHFEHIHTILVKLIARYNFFYYLSHNFFLSNFYLLNLTPVRDKDLLRKVPIA